MSKPLKGWNKSAAVIIISGSICWLLCYLYLKMVAVPTVNSIAFSPDGKILAGAGGWLIAHDGDDLGGAVWLWDARNGVVKQRLTGHFSVLQVVAFSTDGLTVAGWQRDGRRLLWNVETGQLLNTEESPPSHNSTGYLINDSLSEQSAASTNNTLPFIPSPCGNRIATAADIAARKLKITAVQRVLDRQHNETLLALSANGLMMANSRWKDRDNTGPIVLRNLSTGKIVQTLPEEISSAYPVRFSPDNTMIALQHHGGSSPSALSLWDIRLHKLRSALKSEVVFPLSLAYSPDGKILAESGGYGTVELWDVSTGKVLHKWGAG